MPPKKPKTTPRGKSSLVDKIVTAIRAHPPSHKGVSRVAITKYLAHEDPTLAVSSTPAKLKQALKRGVQAGLLTQLTTQSFAVAGDALPVAPPEETVQIKDVKQGKGPAAVAGDTVLVKYKGTLVSDGSPFDAAPSFEFVLGAGDVIQGWDLGVAGMQVGGQRTLVVPAKLGYGKRGAAPEIPPNADLHFTVTLKKILAAANADANKEE